jgi:hypothetical protein
MAAVRQLAGERKGLGSGAQSARQANSLLANLQAAGVDRAALAAAAAAAAAAIRVVGAPSTPPPLSLSGLALRGEAAAAGADGCLGCLGRCFSVAAGREAHTDTDDGGGPAAGR